jgi:hypothetical protein
MTPEALLKIIVLEPRPPAPEVQEKHDAGGRDETDCD